MLVWKANGRREDGMKRATSDDLRGLLRMIAISTIQNILLGLSAAMVLWRMKILFAASFTRRNTLVDKMIHHAEQTEELKCKFSADELWHNWRAVALDCSSWD
eukprot:TRINITY_DN18401_c0_g1_i3.p1 TRINITY_DN18401_c0_g1~~TRINITY_DN18401_c0_g1_i3.p1  ORF type:complete len:103 (-),score=18.37 TRINITY_DN18401_c0_g1_i3:38-346(-)